MLLNALTAFDDILISSNACFIQRGAAANIVCKVQAYDTLQTLLDGPLPQAAQFRALLFVVDKKISL